MSVLHDAMSHAVLGWVKPELDETLRQARGEIEAFVEDPTDTSRLRFSAGYLHQVQGTLRMVELYAPALIAEEMELLTLAVQDGQVANRDEAFAALLHGMVSLPDYLERLQGGYREIPVVLLPLLNNIRSARGADELDESALFLPNLNRPLPIGASQASSLSWAQRQARLGAAQSALDSALAAWPENDAPENIGGLIGSANEWLGVAQYDSTRCMAWVLASVAEALRDKVIEPSAVLRDAFHDAADALRQAREEDGIPVNKAGVPTQEPTRALLYLVARSNQAHPALDALRETFDLGVWRPSEAELEHARSSLSGRNQELLATVGGVIKEDLLRVKDALDLLLRTDGDAATLGPQVAELANIAETLGMLGMETARDVILRQRDTLQSMVSGAQPATEDALLDVAGALLYVDAALDDETAQVAASGAESDKDPGTIGTQRTIEVLVHEAIVNFTTAREHFVAFIETNWDHARLTDVPDLLSVVVGALRILELPAPAGYLEGVRRYIATELLEKRRVPSGRQLDTLADAMASLEYYLEALRDRRPNRDEILDIARSSLESLRYWPLPDDAVVEEQRQTVTPPDTVAPLSVAVDASVVPPSEEVAKPVAIPEPAFEAPEPAAVSEPAAIPEPAFEAPEPTAVSEPVAIPEPAFEAPESAATSEPTVETHPPSVSDVDVEPVEDIIEQDVSPVTLAASAAHEVQGEEMETAGFTQPDSNTEVTTWRDLSAILGGDGGKGMVEAPLEPVPDMPMGEPVSEDLVPSGELQVSSTVETEEILPAVVESREDAAIDIVSETPDIAAFTEEDISTPSLAVFDEAQAQESVRDDVPVSESVPVQPETSAVEAKAFTLPATMFAFQEKEDIDDETREIFLEELDEETENLSQLLPVWKAEPQNIDKLRPVRRIFHTLKGSGRMVGAGVLGEFSWKIESMLNRVLEGRRSASGAVIAMIEQAYELLPQLGAALRGEGNVTTNVPAMEEIAERIAAGEDVYFVPAEHVFVPTMEAVAEEVPAMEVVEPEEIAADELDGMAVEVDGVLLEILESEVANHLSTIRQWLDAAQSMTPEARIATDPLLRAIHTMNGAFAMAEVPIITAVTGKTESYVRRLLANARPMTEDGIVAVSDAADAIERCVKILRRPAPRIPRFEDLIFRLGHLVESLPDVRYSQPEPAPELAEMLVGDDGTFEDFDDEFAEQFEAALLGTEVDADDTAPIVTDAAETGELVERAEHEPSEPSSVVDSADTASEEMSQAYETAITKSITEQEEAVEAEVSDAIEEMATDTRMAHAEPTFAASDVVEETVADADGVSEQAMVPAGSIEEEAVPAVGTEAAGAVAEPVHESPVVVDLAAGIHEVVEQPVSEIVTETDAARIAAQSAALSLTNGQTLDFAKVDRDLVDIFVEEGVELLDHADQKLSELRELRQEHSLIVGLQRDLHTLKGGARMAGIMAMGDLGHTIESLLEAAAAGRLELQREDVQMLERGFDTLQLMLTHTRAYRAVVRPEQVISEFENRLHGRKTVVAPPEVLPSEPAVAAVPEEPVAAVPEESIVAVPEPAVVEPATVVTPVVVTPVAAIKEEMPTPAAATKQPAAQEHVRVRADLMDQLTNQAGEVAVYRSRLEQQLGAFHGAMAELGRTNARLHDQLRRLDLETEAQIVARYQREQDRAEPAFDPLELDRFSTLQQLSRALAETAADLAGLQGVLDDLARQYDMLLQQQSRVSSELQDSLMQARMVPFDSIVPRLRRVVRQAAQDSSKQVRLVLDDAHGEIDRHVIDHMVAPLEHMLRNSVAHGVEKPEQRKAAGKPEEGVITIRLRYEGSEIVLQVSDDGRGLDREAIRRRAEERGLIAPGAELNNTELDALVFRSGFSTSDGLSQLAGRGVGLDVVRNELGQLGGSVDIKSVTGKGTTFTMHLPQALAVTQAVYVQIGETTYAVPVTSVSGIGRVHRDRFKGGDGYYRYAGENYTLYDLGALVGQTVPRTEMPAQVPLLLVGAGDLRAAVAIDHVAGSGEISVKSVGPQITSIPGIYGATITADGTVVVILDVAPLVRRYLARSVQTASQLAEPVPEADKVPLVMVVDDSLTMRKVTGRILERHNMEVVTARDGVEALETLGKMEERIPDLMLLDIEMPRMDGYELASAMRADPRFKGIPIMMITSRTGEKHRQRAYEIGVQRYLGKPYQEADLMRNIQEMLG